MPVLIVEDDHELGPIFMEILVSTGLAGELIQDGQIAYERLGVAEPDLVVIDLHLPGVSGLELLEYIRGDARLDNTRVVVMTADVPMADVAGKLADEVLIKPASVESFVEMIHRFTHESTDS
jgi:CheY-like chemotaxis protein